MGTDDLFKKRKGVRKQRKENVKIMAPQRYLIICEGRKTEPSYFRGMRTRIYAKYRDRVDIQKIELDIEGTGRNTTDLVNYAIEKRNLSEIPYGQVWVVFDRDDFSEEQFNNAIMKANNNGINAAWSNEAIELWFLLHFEYLVAAIHRSQYIQKLSEYFKLNGINHGNYQKRLENVFDILVQFGDIYKAIERAKKLHYSHENKPEALMNPCTTVYKIVEELLEYMDI